MGYRNHPEGYRNHPEEYLVDMDEQALLICEPYKSELLAHRRFRTPEIAKSSSRAIYRLSLKYLEHGDFLGADLARRFLQMGFTRARRYTTYKGRGNTIKSASTSSRMARATRRRRSV